VLHLSWPHLLGALEGSVPLLALHISLNGFVEEAALLVDLGSTIGLVDLEQPRTERQSNILDAILGVRHRQVEAALPNLIKSLRTEHCLSDFQVSVDGFLVIM
jgi:hypothetical protein